jgi:hypothetical protein
MPGKPTGRARLVASSNLSRASWHLTEASYAATFAAAALSTLLFAI